MLEIALIILVLVLAIIGFKKRNNFTEIKTNLLQKYTALRNRIPIYPPRI
jgi:hypothetical protein